MSTVRITANDKQIALLVDFCVANNIGCEVEKPASTNSIPTDFRTPSLALKHFCGAEMMTSRGKMKPIEALDFILAYASRNSLIEKVSITLDCQLQEVFGTQETSIQQLELPGRVMTLFSD